MKTSNTINRTRNALKQFALGVAASAVVVFGSGLTARADYSNTVASFNPVGYWRLNDTTPTPQDTATNSGTLGAVGYGLYQGSPTHPAALSALVGSSDTALSMSGAQSVSIPYSAALNPATHWSAEIWVYPAAANAAAAVMSSGLPAASARTGWVLYELNDHWSFRPFTGNANLTVTGDANGINSSANTVTLNAWQHLVVVNDGTNCLLYLNGALDGSYSASTYVAATSGGTTIGSRYGSANNFNGTLDECVFYTNALSAADVLAHYNNGINPTPSPSYYALVQVKSPAG